MALEVLTCIQCGFDWQRQRVRGSKPQSCPDCKDAQRTRAVVVPMQRAPQNRIDPQAAGYRMALAVTTYRLAIEEAAAALRLGRPSEALAALDLAAAPARQAPRRGNNARAAS